MTEIIVIKQDPNGIETIRWPATLLSRNENSIVVEARFSLSGHYMGDIPLDICDRFEEIYYADRWYNCYEVHSHTDDRIKCWYYNIASPAEISNDSITFRDLVLDLLVYPGGRQQVLDKDEFEAQQFVPELREKILATLHDLQQNLDVK